MSKIIFGILSAILVLNSHVCAVQPQDVLKDESSETVTDSGVSVRKGTIYATILNIRQFDQLIKENDSSEKSEKIEKIKQDISSVIPALEAVKLFELFSPEEWLIYRPGNEGRLLVGLLYLQQFPQHWNAKIIDDLNKNLENFSWELQQEIKKTMNVYGKVL